MNGITGTILSACGMFAGTNVDDLIVLTILFPAAHATGRPWHIWAGQYIGIAALIVISVTAALGLTIVPDEHVNLLGLIPIALGIRALITAFRSPSDAAPPMASGPISIAALTIANGADNIAVYTPVFRTIGPASTLITITVFALGVALWCWTASRLASHKKLIALLDRYGHWLVPAVFITIGALILASTL
ncbi:cadmium resistance transporter [Actinomadura geliboluensis]|uniref:cadmium resistance transporter n=1 Tax=Actinomadura geliboluensis TaxID=882440 RepID=UPI003718287E